MVPVKGICGPGFRDFLAPATVVGCTENDAHSYEGPGATGWGCHGWMESAKGE